MKLYCPLARSCNYIQSEYMIKLCKITVEQIASLTIYLVNVILNIYKHYKGNK